MNNETKPRHADVSGGADPLDVATRRYYYKPMAAFFNAFHLRAYRSAEVRLESPVLDVGCSDGEFGVMLAEILGTPDKMTGVELEQHAIDQASDAARAVYREMICADAVALPFPDQSFATVVSNASIISIYSGLEDALKEVHRVLVPGGTFYATMCTDQYQQNYWLTRLLTRLGCRGLAQRYMKSMNRRMQQAHLYSPGRWVELFEQNGLTVVNQFGFLPLTVTPLWSFLAWTPLRVLSAVKLIPCAWFQDRMRALYRRWFSGLYHRTAPRLDPNECGYIFMTAVKKE